MITSAANRLATNQADRQRRFARKHPEVHFAGLPIHNPRWYFAWIPDPDKRRAYVRLGRRLQRDLLDYLEVLFGDQVGCVKDVKNP